jgi:hypothetical protein
MSLNVTPKVCYNYNTKSIKQGELLHAACLFICIRGGARFFILLSGHRIYFNGE